MLVDKAFSHASFASLGVVVGVGPHFGPHEGPVDQILTLVDRPELSEVAQTSCAAVAVGKTTSCPSAPLQSGAYN